jgi:hypothetical protein
VSDEAYALSLAPSARRVLDEGPPRGLPLAVAAAVTEFLTGHCWITRTGSASRSPVN